MNPLTPFEPYIAEKLISRRDSGDLTILNYTDKCTYSKTWDRYTKAARGLILNRVTGECVAKPFPKFFNVNETPETQFDKLPNMEHRIFTKLDGSLGILYRQDGTYKVASRGAFESPQAVWATQFLQSRFRRLHIPDEVTFLFEIIYPDNKIVVDYNYEDLVVIGAYNRFTGEEYEWAETMGMAYATGFTVVDTLDHMTILDCIARKAELPPNQEGWVIRFANGLRVKVKGDEYLRYARILMGLTPKRVWESMKNGKVTLGEEIPEEFQESLKSMTADLEAKYWNEYDSLLHGYEQVCGIEEQKDFAIAIQHNPRKAGMFALRKRDQPAVDEWIMKQIRPKNTSQGTNQLAD